MKKLMIIILFLVLNRNNAIKIPMITGLLLLKIVPFLEHSWLDFQEF